MHTAAVAGVPPLAVAEVVAADRSPLQVYNSTIIHVICRPRFQQKRLQSFFTFSVIHILCKYKLQKKIVLSIQARHIS